MRRAIVILAVAAGCSQPARDGVSRSEERPATLPLDAAVAETPPVDVPPDAPPLAVVEAPIKWSATRAQLTLEYRRLHSDENATNLDIEPRVVVLHYTAGGSAKGTRSYFDNERIEASRKELAKAGAVNVSSHYLVDRDGTIYRLQPETRFARHCIGLNHIAIGVENVGDEAKWPLTEAQVTANAALVRDLAARFPITHLLGHHEVMGFKQHEYYVERDSRYGNNKPDPGAKFMTKVRALVEELKLSGPSS
ncbi:MAG: N-acetylmuramoyl-L-alanine amidase [Myxococcota bacterium]|nr:N-acetylmuramoyl-L-alanine amidase [Myxococcota bacterium]